LKHQYRAQNYQRYSELIHDLLQAEKRDELTMRNHHQRPVGMAPLPEVNYSSQGKEKMDGVKPSKNVGKFKKEKKNNHKKNRSKDQSSMKGKKFFKCHYCGGANHIAKKCKIPNTWSTCTRNPSKRLEKQNDRMKLISTLHPMRLRLRASTLMKLKSQVR
jgi:hypothetical protein